MKYCTVNDYSEAATEYIVARLPMDEYEQMRLFGVQDLAPAAIAAITKTFRGPKTTFYFGDVPLVSGGFLMQRQGVFSSWFLASEYAWNEHGAAVTAMTAARIKFMVENGAHRIETVCLAKRKLAQRWYRSLGLRLESTMTGFCTDGSDAVMYVTRA